MRLLQFRRDVMLACGDLDADPWPWKLPWGLQMRGLGLQPSVISYNASISAFEQGQQWEKALQLLEQMRGQGIEPNVISYSATISACEKGQQLSLIHI